jgi:hypothetical protein
LRSTQTTLQEVAEVTLNRHRDLGVLLRRD